MTAIEEIGLAILELLIRVAPGVVDAIKDPEHVLHARVQDIMAKNPLDAVAKEIGVE